LYSKIKRLGQGSAPFNLTQRVLNDVKNSDQSRERSRCVDAASAPNKKEVQSWMFEPFRISYKLPVHLNGATKVGRIKLPPKKKFAVKHIASTVPRSA
jgi:hypothetical protein